MSLTGTEVPQYPDATAGAPVLWCVAAARRPSGARSSSWGSLNRRATASDVPGPTLRTGPKGPGSRPVAISGPPEPRRRRLPRFAGLSRAPTPSPEPAELRAPSLEQDLARPRSLPAPCPWLARPGLGSPAGLSGSALRPRAVAGPALPFSPHAL